VFQFLQNLTNPLLANQQKPPTPPKPPGPPPPPPGAPAPATAAKPPAAAQARPPASPEAIDNAVGHYAEGSQPPVAAAPPPAAAHEDAGEHGEKKEVDAKSVASSMDKMLGGVRVGFDKPDQILDALRGKDAATIAAMKEEFKRRMGKDADMEDWVLKQQGATKKPGNVTEAMALLSGDEVEAAAWGLSNATDGKKPDASKIMSVLQNIKDPDTRKKVMEKYGQLSPDKPLSEEIEKLKGSEKDKADALLAGDFATAKAVDMDTARGGGAGLMGALSSLRVNEEEKDTIGSTLRGAESPEERQKILMAYAKRRGGPCKTPEEAAAFFKKDAEKFTKEGADRDFFNAVADGKESEAAAASIEKAQKAGNLDTVVKEMETPIDDKLPPEEKKKQLEEHQKKMADISRAWAEKYGEKDKDGKPSSSEPPKEQFADMLTKAAGGGSMAKGAQSAENLRLQTVADEGQMDRYTMVQYGRLANKPEMIAKAMEGLDAKQIQELSSQGTASGDVVSAIYDTAKGRKQKDLIRDAMYGETPSTAEDALDKASAMHDEERGKGAGLLHGVVDKLSDKDEQMDTVKSRVDELKAKQAKGSLTPEEEAEAKKLAMSMQGSQKGYRADEDTTAKAVTTPLKMGATLALKPVLGPLAPVASKGLTSIVNGMLTGEYNPDDAKEVGSSALGTVTEMVTGSDLAGSAVEAASGLAMKDKVSGKDVFKSVAGVAGGAASSFVGEQAGDFAKEHIGELSENELVKMAAEKAGDKAGEKATDKLIEKATDKSADKLFGKGGEAEEEEGAEEPEAAEHAEHKTAAPAAAMAAPGTKVTEDDEAMLEQQRLLQAQQQAAQQKQFAK
jgi:hypothetical protein